MKVVTDPSPVSTRVAIASRTRPRRQHSTVWCDGLVAVGVIGIILFRYMDVDYGSWQVML